MDYYGIKFGEVISEDRMNEIIDWCSENSIDCEVFRGTNLILFKNENDLLYFELTWT